MWEGMQRMEGREWDTSIKPSHLLVHGNKTCASKNHSTSRLTVSLNLNQLARTTGSEDRLRLDQM